MMGQVKDLKLRVELGGLTRGNGGKHIIGSCGGDGNGDGDGDCDGDGMRESDAWKDR
jgi:hypothetical protein